MSKNYSQELKKLVISQYKRKKEEYELSLRPAEDTLSADGIETRSTHFIPLRVTSVGFDSNSRKHHHTDRYEVADGANATPIYRRGDSFRLKLTFNRLYNPQTDSVFLVVSFGPNASISRGTKYSLPLLPSKPERNIDQWAVWIEENNGSDVAVEIYTPANCLVGIWRFRFSLSSHNPKEDAIIEPENIFYILFNPWCEDDEVYMEKEEDREAYVMCDYGNLFQGTYKQPSAKHWVYGQFDFSVLPSIFLLIEKSTYPVNRRGSAALMVRALAAVINANDDNGLLIGKWFGDFNDGVIPDMWTGSVGIFDKFLNDGGDQPVKYAQCWVFGGCLTTACRAIGIPCRSVTCFQSAHDSDQSLTIGYYMDYHGRPIKTRNSIWNYHVWNEVWMKRLDLPDGYNGWQVADSTPQEKSKDLFRVGPTPVKAVHDGDLGLNFDVPFVFAEVNADMCYYQVDSRSSWGFKLIQRDTKSVGILIVTDLVNKGPQEEGKAYMERLGHNYKYLEGSAKEREVYMKALRQLPKAQSNYEPSSALPEDKVDDVDLAINNVLSVVFGEPFDISVSLENRSSDARSVEIQMRADALLYTGTFVTSIKEELVSIYLQPHEKKEARVTVHAEDYQSKLDAASHIKMTVAGTVRETQQFLTSDDIFEVIWPKLEIKVQENLHQNSPFLVTFLIKNPFSVELTNCTLTVEAGNLRRPSVIEISNVPSHGELEKTIELMPRRVGKCVIVGVLKSDQETHIRGSTVVDILN